MTLCIRSTNCEQLDLMRYRGMSVLRKICWIPAVVLYLTSTCGAQVPPPLTLDQAISEAMANNLNLIAERYNLSVAETRIITARLRPNPVFSAGGDHLDLLGTGYNRVNMAGPEEYAVRTDFILEGAGKRDNRIAVA